MKKAALFLWLALTVLFSNSAFAGESFQPCKQVTGKVLKFDPTEGILVIKNKKGEFNARINEKTCLKTDQDLKLQYPIRPGDALTIRYIEKDGMNLAKTIVLKPSPKRIPKGRKHKKHHPRGLSDIR